MCGLNGITTASPCSPALAAELPQAALQLFEDTKSKLSTNEPRALARELRAILVAALPTI